MNLIYLSEEFCFRQKISVQKIFVTLVKLHYHIVKIH